MDPVCTQDVVRLVRCVAHGHGSIMDADALSNRMERLLQTFPPTETTMQRLSLMQQSTAGTAGEEEFCVVLVYTIAMITAPLTAPPRPPPLRSQSEQPLAAAHSRIW